MPIVNLRRRKLQIRYFGSGGSEDLGPQVDFDFDQGSIASYTIVDETAPTVRITPYKHWNGTTWAWWAVRSKWWTGKTPHFLIDKANHFNLISGEWLACWSTAPDSDTWYQFDNVTIGASDIEFYHNTAFPGGTIYIAALPMYPFSRVQRRVGVMAASSLVGETASTTNKIIGRMTGRDANDGTGRISPGLALYGFKVANATANTKNKAVLSSLQHPSETPGAFALEGALDWLTTTGAAQKFLLDWFEFFVYPCRNVQGVYSGYFRVQPQNKVAGADFTTTGQWEEVDKLKPAIVADIGGAAADVMLDYHSYMDAGVVNGYVVNGDTTGKYPLFAAAMTALDASFTLDQAAVGGEDGTLGKYLRDNYSVTLYSTLENHGATARGITEWKGLGSNSLKALAQMVAQGNFTNGPGVGSRDFTASTNRIDRASAANLTGHALTLAFWVKMDTLQTSAYLVCLHDAGDVSYGIIVNTTDAVNGYLGFLVNGTTYMQHSSNSGALTTGAWINIIVTWDGVITTAASAKIYKNGTEVTYSVTTNGATETTHTGSWSLGGRIYDDTRNISDAKIAQFGVWDRVITAGEIAALAAGQAPNLAAASGLLSYLKANTSSLTDAADAATWTADGTSQLTGAGNGPGIIYP